MTKNEIKRLNYVGFGNENEIDPARSAAASDIVPARMERKWEDYKDPFTGEARRLYFSRTSRTLGGTRYCVEPTDCDRGHDFWVTRFGKDGKERYLAFFLKDAKKLVTWLALEYGDIQDDSEAR